MENEGNEVEVAPGNQVSCMCKKVRCNNRRCGCMKAGLGCKAICSCTNCDNRFRTRDQHLVQLANSTARQFVAPPPPAPVEGGQPPAPAPVGEPADEQHED